MSRSAWFRWLALTQFSCQFGLQMAPSTAWIRQIRSEYCALLTLPLLACGSPALPALRGGPATSPAPGQAWRPPPELRAGDGSSAPVPADLNTNQLPFSLTQLVALALERNPETSTAWLSSRTSAARLGNSRSSLYPTITADVATALTGSSASNGRSGISQQSFSPSISLNWLIYDFGARAGNISAAEAALLSADWNHNALLSDLARRTAQAYFNFAGTQSLLEAEQLTWEQARTNLAATEDRRAVGVATVADVLQARTAVAQAELSLRSAEGAVATARGSLATLAGLPPTTRFTVDTTAVFGPIGALTDSVTLFINTAMERRPDLAAARAQVEQRQAEAQIVASQQKPALALSGNLGQNWTGNGLGGQANYRAGLGLSIPLFNGLGWQYAAEAATLAVESQTAQARLQEQQIALQVFITWQGLLTSTQRVRASDELFASARESAAAARARYQGEVGSLLELLTAEGALADARAQRIQARVQWQNTLIQLAHDTGLLGLDGSTPIRLSPLSPDSLP